MTILKLSSFETHCVALVADFSVRNADCRNRNPQASVLIKTAANGMISLVGNSGTEFGSVFDKYATA